ncbi:hypothetical protein ALC56_00409, partial [Trachymyrmex septentrionalis]
YLTKAGIPTLSQPPYSPDVAPVVQHIKSNWREYGPFVIAEWNISDCQEYYDYMSLVGTFASELECTVATKLHRMNLSIYRELPGRYELKLVFHNRVNINYETARLLFTGCSESGHYDVLLPDSILHSYAAIVGPTFSCSFSLWLGPIPFTLLHRDFNLVVISLADLKSLSMQITEHPPLANSSARDSPRADETPAIYYRKHLSVKKELFYIFKTIEF